MYAPSPSYSYPHDYSYSLSPFDHNGGYLYGAEPPEYIYQGDIEASEQDPKLGIHYCLERWVGELLAGIW